MGRRRYVQTKVAFGRASVPVAADEIKTSNMTEHSLPCLATALLLLNFIGV